MSEKGLSEWRNAYERYIYDSSSKLVVACTSEPDQVIGMGLGRTLVHEIYVPKKSGRIDDI